MKIIATLACRNNSKRLYGKPLQYLRDHTVLEYMVASLRARPEIAGIVLAISESRGNEVFIDVADKLKIPYVMGDDRDVLKRLILACEKGGGDTAFRVTTESPFIYLSGLPEAIKSHSSLGADYTTIAKLPDGVGFELISLSALKTSHDNGSEKHRSELCTLYINENKEKFKINVITPPEAMQRPDYRLTIDFPEDLILCRKIVQQLGGDKTTIPSEKVVALLDESPELRKLVKDITDPSYVKPYY